MHIQMSSKLKGNIKNSNYPDYSFIPIVGRVISFKLTANGNEADTRINNNKGFFHNKIF